MHRSTNSIDRCLRKSSDESLPNQHYIYDVELVYSIITALLWAHPPVLFYYSDSQQVHMLVSNDGCLYLESNDGKKTSARFDHVQDGIRGSYHACALLPTYLASSSRAASICTDLHLLPSAVNLVIRCVFKNKTW
jgi:hypothetical protein